MERLGPPSAGVVIEGLSPQTMEPSIQALVSNYGGVEVQNALSAPTRGAGHHLNTPEPT